MKWANNVLIGMFVCLCSISYGMEVNKLPLCGVSDAQALGSWLRSHEKDKVFPLSVGGFGEYSSFAGNNDLRHRRSLKNMRILIWPANAHAKKQFLVTNDFHYLVGASQSVNVLPRVGYHNKEDAICLFELPDCCRDIPTETMETLLHQLKNYRNNPKLLKKSIQNFVPDGTPYKIPAVISALSAAQILQCNHYLNFVQKYILANLAEAVWQQIYCARYCFFSQDSLKKAYLENDTCDYASDLNWQIGKNFIEFLEFGMLPEWIESPVVDRTIVKDGRLAQNVNFLREHTIKNILFYYAQELYEEHPKLKFNCSKEYEKEIKALNSRIKAPRSFWNRIIGVRHLLNLGTNVFDLYSVPPIQV